MLSFLGCWWQWDEDRYGLDIKYILRCLKLQYKSRGEWVGLKEVRGRDVVGGQIYKEWIEGVRQELGDW